MKSIWLVKDNITMRNLPYVFTLIFFGGLFLLGYPQPMIDDLFFVGAGLNLAHGGNFSNPMLERQQFPSDLYFLHPPLHSYTIACWLKFFGVSAESLMAFQTVMYVIVCWASIKILRQYQAPRLLEWLLPLAVATAFLPIGLRPEPLSAALTMLGFSLLECFGRRELIVFFGFLFIFLGASVASRLSFFSAALALASFIRIYQGGFSLIRLVVLAGSALVIALLSFSFLIGFHFLEFFKIYHLHAAGRIGSGKIKLLLGFFTSLLGVTQWPLIFLWLASLSTIFLMRSKNRDLIRISFFIFGAAIALALIGGLGHGAIWYMILGLFVMTALYAKQALPSQSMVAQILVAVVLVVANSRSLVEVFGLVTGHIVRDENVVQAGGGAGHRPQTYAKPPAVD